MRLPAWLTRSRSAAAGSRAAEPAPVASGDAHRVAIDKAAAASAAGAFGESLAALAPALARSPGDAELWLARGATLLDSGRLIEAGAAFAKAEANGCTRLALYLNGAQTFYLLGRFDEAQAAVDQALRLDPSSAVAHFGGATIQRMKGEHARAIALYQRVIELDPARTDCLNAIAGCHVDLRDGAAARKAADAAIAARPADASAWATLGMACMLLDDVEASRAAFERAEALEETGPGPRQVFVNHGFALLHFGCIDEAIALFRARLPDNPSVQGHTHYGFALLTSGRLREGWEHYEFRWLQEPLGSTHPTVEQPVWSGQPLAGKTLLIVGEQGAGDLMQFARFGTVFRERGARVVLQVTTALKPFAQAFTGFDRVLGREDPIGHFDYYLPMMSIPRALGLTVDAIPAPVPYYTVDGDRLAMWSQRLASTEGLRVGLAWAGSPAYQKDAQRSMKLRTLEPLLSLPGITWHSLQKVMSDEDAAVLAAHPRVVDLTADQTGFAETAAIIANLDLVVSVDTAVAHVAGMLGKPVWLMLPAHWEFRWMERATRTPWYPATRLFRQSDAGDWHDVVERVAAQLLRCVEERITNVPDGDPTESWPVEGPDDAPRGLTTTLETRHGVLQVQKGGDPSVDALERDGTWLPRALAALLPLVPPDGVILELGSGIGIHSIALAQRLGPSTHVLVAEADARRQQLAQQNVTARRLGGQVTVLRHVPSRIRSFGNGQSGSADGSSAPSFVDELWLDRLDLLKLHGTPHPHLDLESATGTLWRLRPAVAVTLQADRDLVGVVRVLHAHGYRTWRCDEDALDSAADGEALPVITLIAWPEERTVPDGMHDRAEVTPADLESSAA